MTPAWVFWIAPLAVAAFGAILVIGALAALFTGKLFKASRGLLLGGAITATGLAVAFMGLNVQTYQQLSLERPLAEVQINVSDLAGKWYEVKVTRLDEAGSGLEPTTCRIQGDEFDISAWTLKWKPWANVLGLNSRFKLEQMTNRYFPGSGFGQTITGCVLTEAPPMNAMVPERIRDWLLSVGYDTAYGSATFAPMADGALYQVMMTQTGLILRPNNAVAKDAIKLRPTAPG
jgi:hypothetical protein